MFIVLFSTNILLGNHTTTIQPNNNVSVTNTTIGNHITWKATNKADVAFYILQRSSDGIQFQTVAMISNNKTEQKFTFLDQKATTTSTYYRILNVNARGDGQYSEIIKVLPSPHTVK